MPGNPYLDVVAGVFTKVPGTQVSAGAGDANKIVALTASGTLDSSVLPPGVGANTKPAVASETLAAGNLVNVYSNASVTTVRKADATTPGKEANGFVLAGFASAATATVYWGHQLNNAITGLTPGVKYYLSTTAGGAVSTSPTATGQVSQYVGTATAAGELEFAPGPAVSL
jgi:hypothetical protein